MILGDSPQVENVLQLIANQFFFNLHGNLYLKDQKATYQHIRKRTHIPGGGTAPV